MPYGYVVWLCCMARLSGNDVSEIHLTCRRSEDLDFLSCWTSSVLGLVVLGTEDAMIQTQPHCDTLR